MLWHISSYTSLYRKRSALSTSLSGRQTQQVICSRVVQKTRPGKGNWLVNFRWCSIDNLIFKIMKPKCSITVILMSKIWIDTDRRRYTYDANPVSFSDSLILSNWTSIPCIHTGYCTRKAIEYDWTTLLRGTHSLFYPSMHVHIFHNWVSIRISGKSLDVWRLVSLHTVWKLIPVVISE